MASSPRLFKINKLWVIDKDVSRLPDYNIEYKYLRGGFS